MGGGKTFGVTNDKQLCKSYRKCVLLPSEGYVLRNTRNPNQYTSRCYTHCEKGGEITRQQLLKELKELKAKAIKDSIERETSDGYDKWDRNDNYGIGRIDGKKDAYNKIIKLLEESQ